jgi:hypothetical protein
MKLDLEPVSQGWIVWHATWFIGSVRMITANEFQCAISMVRAGKAVLQECGRAEIKEDAVRLVAQQRLAYLRPRRKGFCE